MIGNHRSKLTIIVRKLRRGSLTVSKANAEREFGLTGDIHVVEELAGSPYAGKSVTAWISSKFDSEWLAKIEREVGAENSIGLVEIREELKGKSYDFDGEIKVESPILVHARLSSVDCRDIWNFFETAKNRGELTYVEVVFSGDEVPKPGPMNEYALLNDIPTDRTRHFSLQSVKVYSVETSRI